MAPVERGSRRAVLSRDTDGATEDIQISLWRGMSAGAKLSSAADATDATLLLALAGIRMREPGADAGAHMLAFARLKLGADLSRRLYASSIPPNGPRAMSMTPVDVALLVAAAFERCELRYIVGGSLASSVSGEPRSSLDIDMMVELTSGAIPCVIEALGRDFHADPNGFARAVLDRSSVSVIHLPSATKVDLFVMGALSIEPRQMDRRRAVQLADEAARVLFVYTPEDILLQKLHWYALGHRMSDRQWRDILGIVAVQGDALDLAYLRPAAAEIGVADLLDRALAEGRSAS
jgi:hypothetical protein